MSAPPFFSEALRLAEAGPGLWRGEADPAYSNGLAGAFIGQFGGWSAALLLKAALAEAGPGQSARALNVHFFTPVRPGALSVRTRALRKGKSVSFWQAELAQGEDVRAQAVITLGAARAGALAHHFAAFPQASPPETEGLADSRPRLSAKPCKRAG